MPMKNESTARAGQGDQEDRRGRRRCRGCRLPPVWRRRRGPAAGGHGGTPRVAAADVGTTLVGAVPLGAAALGPPVSAAGGGGAPAGGTPAERLRRRRRPCRPPGRADGHGPTAADRSGGSGRVGRDGRDGRSPAGLRTTAPGSARPRSDRIGGRGAMDGADRSALRSAATIRQCSPWPWRTSVPVASRSAGRPSLGRHGNHRRRVRVQDSAESWCSCDRSATPGHPWAGGANGIGLRQELSHPGPAHGTPCGASGTRVGTSSMQRPGLSRGCRPALLLVVVVELVGRVDLRQLRRAQRAHRRLQRLRRRHRRSRRRRGRRTGGPR